MSIHFAASFNHTKYLCVYCIEIECCVTVYTHTDFEYRTTFHLSYQPLPYIHLSYVYIVHFVHIIKFRHTLHTYLYTYTLKRDEENLYYMYICHNIEDEHSFRKGNVVCMKNVLVEDFLQIESAFPHRYREIFSINVCIFG